jgi:hypothetical protein
VTSTQKYNGGKWHYAVVTYSGSFLSLYIDGILRASRLTYGATPNNLDTQPFRIGANSLQVGGFLVGNVGEVRVWNRELTYSEVSDAFNNKLFNANGHIVYLSFNLEICGDKIDNDNNGVADEDCPLPVQEPTGVIVPLYSYPTSTEWDRLINVKNAHPSVPMVAIVNPTSGPGSTWSSDYVSGINDLRNSGIKVLGYVYTSYGSRSIAEVKSEIDKYGSWYNVHGILFDEMSNIPGNENYYRELTNYVYSKGLTFSAGNPGTSTTESYIGTVDTITIYEGQGVPATSLLNDRTFANKYHKRNFNYVAYGVPSLDTSATKNTASYLGWFYITNDNLPNPWSTLPSYLEQLVAALEM